MSKKVLIATQVHDCLIEKIKNSGYGLQYLEESEYIDFPSLVGIITSNNLAVTREFIDRCPQLKWVGRMGSGMEIIDVEYAKSKGIVCVSSPDGNANAVAEQALGMLLSLQHRIHSSFGELKSKIWNREENRGFEIEGKNAGIIGLGNNGMAFAKKLIAMGMTVFAYDKYLNIQERPGLVICKGLDEIYKNAQILSFHVPLNEETVYYFDDVFLENMQHDFLLLNLSRGKIVSLKSLYKGMKSGKIYAAALDVWEEEPWWDMDSETKLNAEDLMSLPNFIGTPHIAGYTFEAVYKMSRSLMNQLF